MSNATLYLIAAAVLLVSLAIHPFLLVIEAILIFFWYDSKH